MSSVRSRPRTQYAAKSSTTQPAASAMARLNHGGTDRSPRGASGGSRSTGPDDGSASSGSVPASALSLGGFSHRRSQRASVARARGYVRVPSERITTLPASSVSV